MCHVWLTIGSPIHCRCGGGWLELHRCTNPVAYVYVLPGHLFLRYRPQHPWLSVSGEVERRSLYAKIHVLKNHCSLTYDVVFWSVTAWIATSAVILATAPKTDAEFVFTTFTNETGWPDGVAWMLGLLQSAVSYSQLVKTRSLY